MAIKCELGVAALSNSESHPGSFSLIMEDLETRRRIPIIIGLAEAQSIAIAMEQMQPSRPLTHDLCVHLLQAFQAHLKEVLIHSLRDGIFHASLVIATERGEEIAIDARSSDAIAIAVRANVPIYAYDHVVEEAGFLTEVFLPHQRKGSLAEYSLEELEELLVKVIQKEDYESAVRIRNYIDRRKSRGGEV